MANRPAPEIEITETLVRGLLLGQFPEYASLSLQELSRGWDNTNLRLGDSLLVRVPHRQVAAELIRSEQRWLPQLRNHIDLPISAPIAAGCPTPEFPWHWSLTPWFEGREAAGATLADPAATAKTLGTFLSQVHVPAPADAPPNPYRGCPLTNRAKSFHARLDKLKAEMAVAPGAASVDTAALAARFDAACQVPATAERVWLHGDLHARNMVVHHGELTAVIDWGDICAGDRATDLASAYMLVPDQLAIVQEHAGADDLAWQRAVGWAANFAVAYLANSDDDPVMRHMATRLAQALLAS